MMLASSSRIIFRFSSSVKIGHREARLSAYGHAFAVPQATKFRVEGGRLIVPRLDLVQAFAPDEAPPPVPSRRPQPAPGRVMLPTSVTSTSEPVAAPLAGHGIGSRCCRSWPGAATSVARPVAELLSGELGWSEAWIADEVAQVTVLFGSTPVGCSCARGHVAARWAGAMLLRAPEGSERFSRRHLGADDIHGCIGCRPRTSWACTCDQIRHKAIGAALRPRLLTHPFGRRRSRPPPTREPAGT
jgi:hypothetical protein